MTLPSSVTARNRLELPRGGGATVVRHLVGLRVQGTSPRQRYYLPRHHSGARVEVIKANFAKQPWPLLMTIQENRVHFEPWEDATMNRPAPVAAEPPNLQQRLQDYLRERLAAGPLPAAELLKECTEKFDCGERTVYKARDRAGVVTVPDPADLRAKLWNLTEPPTEG